MKHIKDINPETKKSIFRTTEFIRTGGKEYFTQWLKEQPDDFICVKIMHTTSHEIEELKKRK